MSFIWKWDDLHKIIFELIQNTVSKNIFRPKYITIKTYHCAIKNIILKNNKKFNLLRQVDENKNRLIFFCPKPETIILVA